jgi:Na+/proline symporter
MLPRGNYNIKPNLSRHSLAIRFFPDFRPDMRLKFSMVRHVFVALVISVGVILIAIYPHRPADAIGWIVLILLAIPIVPGLEFIGSAMLRNVVLNRMGWPARIVCGVLVVVLISVLLLTAWNTVLPRLGQW